MVKHEREFAKSLEGKGFKKNFLSALGYYLGMGLTLTIVLSIVVFGSYKFQNWQQKQTLARITSGTSSNTVSSESQQRFHVVVPNRVMDFYINVSTNMNKSYLLGMFEVNYAYKTDLTDSNGRTLADVIYYLPAEFYSETAMDVNVSFKETTKRAIQKPARRDPTFYKGKDYPDTIPFDEIEITNDFVYSYVDTNETEYDFIVRVFEKSDDLNIVSVTLLVPPEYEVREG